VWHHAPAAIQQPPAVHCQAASSLLVLLGDSALANVYWLAVQFCLQTDHGSLPWNVACISVFREFYFFCAMALQCAIQISILNFWQRPNVQWHHTNFEFLVKANCAATALECATEISILNFWQRPNEQRQHA